MRFPVSQLTIFVMLVHAALGCCLHHAHECEAGCGDSAVALGNECACESHEHEEHAGLLEQTGDGIHSEGEHHRHDHDCDGIHCTFVRSDRSLYDYSGRLAGAAPFYWDVSLQSGNLNSARVFHALDCPCPDSGLPVRSHLLFSVLLI